MSLMHDLNMNVLLFFYLSFASALIPPGTLDGLLNSSEISRQVQNLTLFYNGISVEDEAGHFEMIHFSNFSDFPSRLEKVKVLVIGGFYAGFPISAYQVVQLADFIAFESFAGNAEVRKLIKSHEFWFLPVVNLKAFQLMEQEFEGEEFLVLQTGLEGNNLNCTEVDTGINGYFNFPLFFEKGNESCSNDFPGNQPLDSNLSRMIFEDFFKKGSPDIVINYQGVGRKFLIPPSQLNGEVSDKFLKYCKNIRLPSGFDLDSKLNFSKKSEFGTFLDFSYNFSKVSVEVALDSTRERTEVVSILSENYKSFLDVVSNFMPQMTVKELTWHDDKCNNTNGSSCHYNEYLSFHLHLINSGFSRFKFTLKFDPGFKNIRDFTAINVFTSQDKSNWTEIPFDTSPTTQILSVNDSVDGFSEIFLKLTYGKNTKNKLTGFDLLSTFISQEFFVEDLNFQYSYRKKNEKSQDDDRNPVVIGWILMGVIVFVVGVAALLLRFVKTGEISKGLTQENPKRADAV
jgi:hypothetical protein